MARRRPRNAQQPAAPTPPVDADANQRATQLVEELRRRLKGAAKPQVAAQLRNAHGEDVPCYGVDLVQANRLGQEVMRRVRGSGLPLSMAIAGPLFRSGNIEEGVAADVIVSGQARLIGGAEFEQFAEWATCLTNAPNTDALASHLISRSLAGRPSLVRALQEWAGSDQRWLRRAAAVAFVPLVREGRFISDALSVAELLMEDADAAVQNGVGTLLMEATRLQGDRVVEFLLAWKDKSPRAVLQAAATKLRPEQRTAVLGR